MSFGGDIIVGVLGNLAYEAAKSAIANVRTPPGVSEALVVAGRDAASMLVSLPGDTGIYAQQIVNQADAVFGAQDQSPSSLLSGLILDNDDLLSIGISEAIADFVQFDEVAAELLRDRMTPLVRRNFYDLLDQPAYRQAWMRIERALLHAIAQHLRALPSEGSSSTSIDDVLVRLDALAADSEALRSFALSLPKRELYPDAEILVAQIVETLKPGVGFHQDLCSSRSSPWYSSKRQIQLWSAATSRWKSSTA